MKKLFARLTPFSEYVDIESYIDFPSESIETGLSVIAGDRYMSFKSDAWKKIEEVIDHVSYYLENLVDYESPNYYRRASDVLDDYLPGWTNGKKRSSRLIHAWKEAVSAYDRNGMKDETACRLLELYTGEKYESADISGSCQGDFATVYFKAVPTWEARKKYVEAISAYYFGTGAEVQIHEGEEEPSEPDEIDGFWTYIPIPYATENEIKNYLAENYGSAETTPADVILYIPEESHTVTTWDYRIA